MGRQKLQIPTGHQPPDQESTNWLKEGIIRKKFKIPPWGAVNVGSPLTPLTPLTFRRGQSTRPPLSRAAVTSVRHGAKNRILTAFQRIRNQVKRTRTD